MSDEAMGVIIEGEPFLSRVRKYREEQRAAKIAWSEFALARGASRYHPGSIGLCFDGKQPEGWTKPKGKNGFSAPKAKDHPDIVAMKALPGFPKATEIFGDAVVYDLSYSSPGGGWGTGAIGWFFNGPRIGWAGDTHFAWIPDARRAVREHLAIHPDDKITNGADKWSLPPGLREVSEAEIDLIVATFKVAQERAGVTS